MAHAGIRNRGTLIALRLLLGAAEAGFVQRVFVSRFQLPCETKLMFVEVLRLNVVSQISFGFPTRVICVTEAFEPLHHLISLL
jgi:hypothetical protein